MKTHSDSCIRYLAAAISDCLMDGLTLEEIKKLYAIVQLIVHNIQSEIALRGIVIIRNPPLVSPTIRENSNINNNNKYKE